MGKSKEPNVRIKGPDELRMTVTFGARRYNYLSFGKSVSFFGKPDENLNVPGTVSFTTDAGTEFTTRILKGRLSTRGDIRRYFNEKKVTEGDELSIKRVKGNSYKITCR